MPTRNEKRVRRPGRPPDAQLDERAFEAALAVYGEAGWVATNLTKIATYGGIGKSSLYDKWGTKDRLLAVAFASILERGPEAPKEPTVREWFIQDGKFRLETYLGKYRNAILRLALEMTINTSPELQELRQNLYTAPLQQALGELRRLRGEGLIPSDTSILRLADAIEGSIYNRAMWVEEDQVERILANAQNYVETVVDEQLTLARINPDLVLSL